MVLAWRLSKQQGGAVRFDGAHGGVTRFVLSLPLTPADHNTHANGYHTDGILATEASPFADALK